MKQKAILKSLIVAVVVAVASCFITALPAAAAEFSCGAYGAGTYNNQACTDGTLENTGQSVWPIVVAALLILAGTILLFRTRKKMKSKTAQQNSQ